MYGVGHTGIFGVAAKSSLPVFVKIVRVVVKYAAGEELGLLVLLETTLDALIKSQAFLVFSSFTHINFLVKIVLVNYLGLVRLTKAERVIFIGSLFTNPYVFYFNMVASFLI